MKRVVCFFFLGVIILEWIKFEGELEYLWKELFFIFMIYSGLIELLMIYNKMEVN